jgi:dihydrofolate reductase
LHVRTIVISMWTTLDGFVAGPDDEMDWLVLDEHLQDYETRLVTDAEALLLGRRTHEDFAGAWPQIARDETEQPGTRAYAQRVHEMPKIVVSRSGKTAEWDHTTRVADLDEETVAHLKDGGDGTLVVYGSLSVIASLEALGMIDEYQLLVHPTAIGMGKALFGPSQAPTRLHLVSAEPFPSGVTLMRYEPAG